MNPLEFDVDLLISNGYFTFLMYYLLTNLWYGYGQFKEKLTVFQKD